MEGTNHVKVADLVAAALEDLGIKHIFGIIGAGNVHLFEAISRRGATEIVCVHHEQAACMAMQTYYRTSGRLAAALLTTGAGSTNGVTGVVSAWADSIPGLVIAGNEHSKFDRPGENPLRMWGTQGYDSVQMVEKVTKHSRRVVDPLDVVPELHRAVCISTSGRPGPVWVEIPMDIQSTRVARDSVMPIELPTVDATASDKVSQVGSVVEALISAERPILWLGHGIRLAGAHELLPALLERLRLPALVSWAGIDMIDSDHPFVFGRAGVYGQRSANFILQNSDYVLAIGTRLAIPQIGYDIAELARAARIDVVDIDRHEAEKHRPRVTESVVADAGDFIRALLEAVASPLPEKSQWLDICRGYETTFPWVGAEHKDIGGFMNSYPFMKLLNRHFKPNQVVVTDMGTALLSGHQVLRFKEGQRLMTSTGLGEMGYGLPGAIGASIALGRSEVMCLNCDGGMMLNLQELQTLVHHRLPIKLFIFNNDGYLMIKHTQNALFGTGYVGTDTASGVSCPDFSKVAAAFDIPAFQIRHWEECDPIIETVQAINGPVICEVFMHPEQLFSPKLSVAARSDGTLVSPPLEDLSPLLPASTLRSAMMVGVHKKSEELAR